MEKQQKKQIKRYITWGCALLLVLLLAVMPLMAKQNVPVDGPQASILTATAERRSITTQLIGGGQLTSHSQETVTIPAAVKLTKYLVGNGDTVKAGDALARVDQVSVMTALEEVQETLDYLSEQIAAVSDDTEPDEVTAQAGGLVKVLYGKKGDSVQDVMLEHGALAVLSLDGRMAVDVEAETQLSHGDTVTVLLSDGAKVSGRVESAIQGRLTVSIKDKDYPIGESVTVVTKDGEAMGTGELYIHSPWAASAYYGTIEKVCVKAGDKVSAGRQLFRLKTEGHSSQFQILNTTRQEYEELMLELFQMYDSGVITAPCDGFVTGVDKDAAFLLAAVPESQGWSIQLLSRTTEPEDPGYTIQLLSNVTPEDPTEATTAPTDPVDPTDPSAPVEPDPQGPAAPYTVRVAQVLENGTVATNPTVYAGIMDLSSVSTVVNLGGTVETWPLSGLYNKDLTTYYPGTATTGNILFHVTDANGNVYYVFAAAASTSGMPGGIGGLGGLGGFGGFGGFSGFGGFGGYSSAPAFTPYSLETLPIATVTPQDKMTLEITVDEQDILRLHTGLTATVTVEALPGQTFPATITTVSATGTNSGGSSKYTATLTLDKTGDMYPYMNASAYLDLDTTENVVTLPATSLSEEGARTLVYTGYDEKNDVLTGPIAVTTGVSDGEYVQILSGVEEGDTIWYTYYDTVEESLKPKQGLGF